MGKRESIIQKRIIDSVKSWGWLYKKTHPGTGGTPKGWPDLEIFVPGGRIVFIEVKREGVDDIAPLQSHWRRKLLDAGYLHFVVNNHGHAVRILKGQHERARSER